MDVAKLNQEILGVDLEYKNVYIDAENTRMIRAKLPDGYCDLVRTDVWNGRVNHPEEHDIVKYTAISWYREEFVGGVDLGRNYMNAKYKFFELVVNKNNILEMRRNMEMKDNKIVLDIPKGMEIDTKNSDLAKGIIKFKPKNLTYEDILQARATDFGGLRVPNHCIDKILAISQLMNIAKYYNGDWKPDWYSYASKFSISFNHTSRKYIVDSSDYMTSGNVLFKKSEDAKTVIDNPNFRNILDAIYKD